MSNKKRIPVILTGMIILSVCTGCDSYAHKKQAAQLRWEKATARAKVPVAREQFENGRTAEARKTLQQCLNADPELAEAHLLMGRIHLTRQRLTEADDSFKAALQLDEKLDRPWYQRAQIARQDERPEQALEYYERAMALKPAKVDYIIAVAETYAAQNNYDDALKLLEKKSKTLADPTVLKVAAADILLQAGNTKKAIEVYNRALLLKPADTDIIESLAYCYIIDRQWAHAAKMFEKLADKAGGTEKQTFLEFLAMCSMNNAEYGRALAYYDQLSVDQRDNPELWLKMGQAALGADAPRRALSCGQRALALRPGWADAVALKGCSQYLTKDYPQAIKTFGKITSNEAMGGFAWFMTARCYQQLRQTAQAEKAYKNAARMDPESKLLALLAKLQ